MANEMTLQTSHTMENSDKCQENVAPEDTAAAGRLKVQAGRVDNCSSTNQSGENLSGTCTFSTPASSGEVKAKSQLFGLQSALTPILKILNIGNKSPSAKPVKSGTSPRLSHPYFTFNRTTACHKTAGGSGQHPNSGLSPSHVGGPLGHRNASVCWLDDEILPEVSLLDDTCDSTIHCVSSATQSSWATASTGPSAKTVDTPARANAPLRWMDDRYFPEITLLDVTQDSDLSPGGGISSEVTQGDNLKIDTPSVKLIGENIMHPSRSDINQSEEFSSTFSANTTDTVTSMSLQSDMCAGENVMKVSLTQDISMGSVEISRSSAGPSEQDVMSQTSTEDVLGIHPANVTRDISSSSDVSAQSATSQLSTTDMQVITRSASELHGDPVGAKNETLPTSCDTEMTSKLTQGKPEMVESANNTFTIAQSSIHGTTNVNTTTEMPPSLNKTLDLSANANRDVDNDTKEQDNLAARNTTESPLKTNQSSSADRSGSSCDVQNGTFDQHSLQKSRESTGLQEAGLQNNTFDNKPSSTQNSTMTLSETRSGDIQQDTLDKSSPSKVCSTTTSPKDRDSDVRAPEPSKHEWTTTSTEAKVKTTGLPELTFESSPGVETASEAEHHDSNDLSQPGLPIIEGLSDTLGHHSMDTGNSKANTFNLDDTLDLKVDYLVTSTPMTNCKMVSLCNEQVDGKVIGAQKKLYGDGSTKPAVQVPSDAPSNIVCDRKTFLKQPAAKSLLPPLKAPSHVLKSKPASTEGGRRLEPSMAGLPMTRQRTQALKNTAAPDPGQGIPGISACYNLRATTAGSKHPSSGLLRPQTTGIPSGIQRPAPSLRPPLARSTTTASSSTDKLSGPTAVIPVVKIPQAKKHTINRVESLPTAKRKKVDAAVPAKTAEASASCETASKARVMKPLATSHRGLLPKPPAHGCAKCIELEEQLKMKSEEIKKLKEELQKYKAQ